MGTPLRLAFAGFQHGHIFSMYSAAKSRTDIQIVGGSETDPATAQRLRTRGEIMLTHTSLASMLAEVPCDAVAIGDAYDRHGPLAIEALSAGKHVLTDKPLCTRLGELDEISRLAKEKKLSVTCQFDLRGSGALRAMRRHIDDGAIGMVHTVNVTAQHPLLLGSRPSWYFQPGRQGGTLNDIACHAMDIIPWITGRSIAEVVVARAWNARLPQYPFFSDAAQFMLRLDNGGGVLGDVSYLAPDGCGYATPQYWRITCHGDGGVIEARDGSLTLGKATDRAVEPVECDEPRPAGYLQDFVDEIAGRPSADGLNTRDVLAASRRALILQNAADENRVRVPMH